MANKAKARVELRIGKYKTEKEAFEEMVHVFKRRCNEAGIMHSCKEHEFYESKSEKKRKKRREAQSKLKKESLASRNRYNR